MGAIINHISSALNRMIGRFWGFQSGSFELCHGQHEVRVPLRIDAESAWTKIVACGCHDGCGQFPVNFVSTHVHGCEIIFVVKVESNMAKIEWFATS